VKAEETRCVDLKPESGASKAVGLPDLRFVYFPSLSQTGVRLLLRIPLVPSTTLPDAAAIAQGFKKKYPFAEVENYRGTGKTNSDFRQRRQQNFHATSWKSVHYPIGCCAFPHR
jgi:hypothetical protein